MTFVLIFKPRTSPKCISTEELPMAFHLHSRQVCITSFESQSLLRDGSRACRETNRGFEMLSLSISDESWQCFLHDVFLYYTKKGMEKNLPGNDTAVEV
jgi:hypothetical protein